MTVHHIDLAGLKLIRPERREARALKELRQALLPFAPFFTIMARIALTDPKAATKEIELPGLGVKIPLREFVRVCELLRSLDDDEHLFLDRG